MARNKAQPDTHEIPDVSFEQEDELEDLISDNQTPKQKNSFDDLDDVTG